MQSTSSVQRPQNVVIDLNRNAKAKKNQGAYIYIYIYIYMYMYNFFYNYVIGFLFLKASHVWNRGLLKRRGRAVHWLGSSL